MLDANTQAILDAVSAHIGSLYPLNTAIVDLGCGEGLLIKKIAELGFTNVTGISYHPVNTPNMINIADIDLCTENWSMRCEPLPYRVAIATEVIEHLTNPFLFLCETRRLLSDKGELIVTFPNVHNLRSIIGYALTGRLSGFFGPNFNHGHPLYDQHIFIPNLHLIRYLLSIAGFSIHSQRFLNGYGCLFSQTVMIVAHTKQTDG